MARYAWMLLLIPLACDATVYRCRDAAGHLSFSDIACPVRGEELPEADLTPNGYEAPAAPKSLRARRSQRAKGSGVACYQPGDVRKLDLLIDSLTSDKRRQTFLKAERGRVLKCKLAKLSAHERRLRDAALERTASIRSEDRLAAQREIEALYK